MHAEKSVELPLMCSMKSKRENSRAVQDNLAAIKKRQNPLHETVKYTNKKPVATKPLKKRRKCQNTYSKPVFEIRLFEVDNSIYISTESIKFIVMIPEVVGICDAITETCCADAFSLCTVLKACLLAKSLMKTGAVKDDSFKDDFTLRIEDALCCFYASMNSVQPTADKEKSELYQKAAAQVAIALYEYKS